MPLIWYEHEENLFPLTLPLTPKEIDFSDFCDFQKEERLYIDLSSPPEELSEEELESWVFPVDESVKQLTRAVSMLAPEVFVEKDKVILPFNIEGEKAKDLIDGGFTISIGDDLSILRLYSHLINIIRKYQPQEIPITFTLTHKGKSFELKREQVVKILTKQSFTTGESVEVMEYNRRKELVVQDKPLEIGNLDFELGLTEVAILVRQPGEPLPWEKKDLDNFIEERRELFKTVKLSDVIALRFFLLDSLITYGRIKTINSFGKEPRNPSVLKSRKQHKRGK